MAVSRKLLCAAYAMIAIAALIATWSQNVANFNSITDFLPAGRSFLSETKVTPASRSITVDILFFFLAAAIFMVIEARGLSGRTSLAESSSRSSVTFPLFLIARELRLADSHATHLRAADTIPLALLAAFVVGLAIWVDVL